VITARRRVNNGIAIGSRDTANADGMVLVNPHFPWNGRTASGWPSLRAGQYNVEGQYALRLVGSWRSVQPGPGLDAQSVLDRPAFHLLPAETGNPPHPTSYYSTGKGANKMGTETVRVNTGRGRSATLLHDPMEHCHGLPRRRYAWTTTTAYHR